MAKSSSPPFSRGMKKKDLEQGGGFGDTCYIKKGDTVPVQFLHEPDDFLVFREHSWEEDRRWFFVPCIGEGCVLCDDESQDRAKTGYQWAAQVYNIKERKAQVLKGGKDLGNRVWYRYDRKPTMFTKRVLEITKFATSPITHEVGVGEDKPVDPSKIKAIDLEAWRQVQLKAYYGDNIPTSDDLDDEEEFEDADDPDTDDDLDDDEVEFEEIDEEEIEEEEEEVEEEEEPEPAPRKRRPAAKTATPTKRPAPKAATRKTTTTSKTRSR